MFDNQVRHHQKILGAIERGYYKHLDVVTIDCSTRGWATGGSGSESGRFDYEGNGLVIVPSWMVAKDAAVLDNASSASALGPAAELYLFLNSKTNPGLPFGVSRLPTATNTFGMFAGVACTFRRFYVFVNVIDGSVTHNRPVHIAVVKGLDLSGIGSPVNPAAVTPGLVGCYGRDGQNYV